MLTAFVGLRFCNTENQETIIPLKYSSVLILKSTKEQIILEFKTQLAVVQFWLFSIRNPVISSLVPGNESYQQWSP